MGLQRAALVLLLFGMLGRCGMPGVGMRRAASDSLDNRVCTNWVTLAIRRAGRQFFNVHCRAISSIR